jgi:hypothetical protein
VSVGRVEDRLGGVEGADGLLDLVLDALTGEPVPERVELFVAGGLGVEK